MKHRNQSILARLGGVAWQGMRAILVGATLCGWLGGAVVRAGVTLLVNGVDTSVSGPITVNAGDPLVFSWTATDDMTQLERSWGNYSPFSNPDPYFRSYQTLLSSSSGEEKVRAPLPSVITSYGFSVAGKDGAGIRQLAGAQVRVIPSASVPEFVPIVWTLPLGEFSWLTGNGVPGVDSLCTMPVVPDAEIGVPYSAILVASGREPITYGAAGLPEGLTLNGNVISGTPTTNAFNVNQFTITATDADGFMTPAIVRMMNPVLYPRVQVPHQAPVVFDLGAPSLNGGYVNDAGAADPGRVAAGFKLATATTITKVRLWGTYYLSGKADQADSFTLKFYERGPSPFVSWPDFPAAGKLIATFTPTSVVRSTTGRAAMGYPNGEYVYDLYFAGLPCQGNTLYYLTVENVSNKHDWMWMTVANEFYTTIYQNYPGWGVYSTDGGLTWPGVANDVAFQLSDGAAPPPPPPTTTTNTFRLVTKTSGKGTVSVSPFAKAYAPGTVVTLTAKTDPADPKSVWKGWTGDVVSNSQVITVTMNQNFTVQANFR